MIYRLNTTSSGCTHTLTLKNLSLKDAGEFVAACEEISSRCILTVNECEKLPKVDLSQVQKSLKVKAGKDINIEVPYECKLNKKELLYCNCKKITKKSKTLSISDSFV